MSIIVPEEDLGKDGRVFFDAVLDHETMTFIFNEHPRLVDAYLRWEIPAESWGEYSVCYGKNMTLVSVQTYLGV
jgi:hypothetical protein